MSGGFKSQVNQISNPYLRAIMAFVYPPIAIQNIISKSEYSIIKFHLFNNDKSKILNIGSGDSIGVGHKLWSGEQNLHVVNLDVQEGPNIDIVADAHKIPVDDCTYDSVIMQSVIEHLHTPRLAIEESYRILKPGGYLYLEVPFLQGFHADPCDFQRYTLPGLLQLTGCFDEVILSGVSSGPFSTCNWLLRDLFSNLTPLKPLNLFTRFLFSWIFFPIKYLDKLIKHTKASERLACEYFILLKK